MLKRLCILVLLTGLLSIFTISQNVHAGIFGEIALSAGGTYPQGTFVRYADPGFMGNLRVTTHAPVLDFFVFWIDISFVEFSREHIETVALTEIQGGPSIIRPIDQVTTENMIAGHIGLQLSNPTRKGFFRPRAAMGIGLYHFRNATTWTEEINDSTSIVLADEVHDSQTSFGWRGLLGADFFIKPNWGITADFVYDHVFKLTRTAGPDYEADLTSRFHGFSVGVIYMFNTFSP